MNTPITASTGIMAGGQKQWEKSPGYKRRVAEVKQEIRAHYYLLLLSERNWIKRLFLRVKCALEIRRRVAELSSGRKLHLSGGRSQPGYFM